MKHGLRLLSWQSSAWMVRLQFSIRFSAAEDRIENDHRKAHLAVFSRRGHLLKMPSRLADVAFNGG
jgi:hypothetical protein